MPSTVKPADLSESKWSRINRIARETFGESTIHGLRNTLKSESYLLKTTWVVLVLISVIYGSYMICLEVNSYIRYPVVSLTRVNYVNSINLPVITVCNLNPFATKTAKQTVLELQKGQLLDNSNDPPTLKYLNARYYASSNALISLNESTKKQFGLTLNETIISCVFNFESCSWEEDFTEFYDPFYGYYSF
jgi:hypothetical protein